jgi:hypothetical protein
VPLTVPYVTTAELVEFPTFLDLLNLRSGDPQLTHQTAVLNKILLMASGWCDSYVSIGSEGTLSAHTRTENKRLYPDRRGRLLWHPDHIPFISLESVSYGRSLTQLTTVTAPSVFTEDERNIVLDLAGATTAWSGSLSFGGPPSGAELLTTWTYTAGYVNTLLTAGVPAGGLLLPVADVIGIQPGQGLRIFDPGLDEPITVASSWVLSAGPGTLPLTTGLLHAHTVSGPVRVSAMGFDILEACVLYAISLLMRPESTAEDAFPDMPGGISTRAADARRDGSGLVGQARQLLASYRRTI